MSAVEAPQSAGARNLRPAMAPIFYPTFYLSIMDTRLLSGDGKPTKHARCARYKGADPVHIFAADRGTSRFGKRIRQQKEVMRG